MDQAGKRLRLEAGLAALSAALFVATLVWPEWIEAVFGVDPDGGDGSMEWLAVAVAAACAVAAILFARAGWRRLRSAREGGLP